MTEKNLKCALVAAALVFAALTSIFLLGGWASSQTNYKTTIDAIDDKVETVLKLTATSTVASAGISAIPGDTATPIAAKLADFTEYFLLILCVLYAEKYLLTIIGAGVFKVVIPLVCGLLVLSLFRNGEALKRLALKLVLISLALFLVIPASVRVSDMIYETYRGTIQETITAAEEFTEDTSGLSDAGNQGLIEAILSQISETASSLSDRAAGIVNRFVESLAVMIVTACVIPILVLLFFLWIIRLVTGVDVSLPARRIRRKREMELTELTEA